MLLRRIVTLALTTFALVARASRAEAHTIRLTVRRWTPLSQSSSNAGTTAFDAGWPALAKAAETVGIHGLHVQTNEVIDRPLPRAKNIILFIGDGMGVASRT